jgi:hypothetical protein
MTGFDPRPLRVAEFGVGMAAAYCTWLLRSMGATPTRLSAPPPEGQNGLALALRFLAEGTHPATSWEDADIVVIDDLPGFEAFAGAP